MYEQCKTPAVSIYLTNIVPSENVHGLKRIAYSPTIADTTADENLIKPDIFCFRYNLKQLQNVLETETSTQTCKGT